MAVTNESLAVQDRKRLKRATQYYDELVTKYPESAEGKFGKERLDILKDAKASKELAATYEELARLFRIDAPVLPPLFPQLKDPLPKPKADSK
jgi:hypothetical protein